MKADRVRELKARMAGFSTIYQAGFMVRHAYLGPDQRSAEAVDLFVAVLTQELRQTSDHVALLYAVADALYASPLGVPWEG